MVFWRAKQIQNLPPEFIFRGRMAVTSPAKRNCTTVILVLLRTVAEHFLDRVGGHGGDLQFLNCCVSAQPMTARTTHLYCKCECSIHPPDI